MRSGRILPSVLVAASLLVACGPRGTTAESPEHAVQRHINAAKSGDVAALRSGSCGELATAMGTHSDDEVRDEFAKLYDAGPDALSVQSKDAGDHRTVVGIYTDATDLEISFDVENHDGWRVCEIRRGNGPFGRLPAPFER
jgi:hypothetical protein